MTTAPVVQDDDTGLKLAAAEPGEALVVVRAAAASCQLPSGTLVCVAAASTAVPRITVSSPLLITRIPQAAGT